LPLVYLLYGGRKEVIRFEERAQRTGIRGTYETANKRVRHVGVGVGSGRHAAEGDGLGSYQEYRRHYGVVPPGYDPEV